LKVVGNNMKSLEISEQEASQREDSYEETIRDLTQRLKDAEMKAERAEQEVVSLSKTLDKMEKDLETTREKNATLTAEMEECIEQLNNL